MILDNLDNFMHQKMKLKMRTSIIHHLLSLTGAPDGGHAVSIYFFPNSSNNHVFVETVNGSLIQTNFTLPSWIAQNVLKILKNKPDEFGTKNKCPAIEEEMQELKKELHLMKNNMYRIEKSIDAMFMNMQ